jgi:hypothetical protein
MMSLICAGFVMYMLDLVLLFQRRTMRQQIIEQCEKDMEEVQASMIEEVQERKRRLEEERNSNDLVEDAPAVINRKSVRGKREAVKEKSNQQDKGGMSAALDSCVQELSY